MSPRIPTPRSKARVASATRQPSLTSPTTRSASVRAPSKNTSLNSEVPVICRMGRTSTPALVHGDEKIGEPLVPRRLGVGATHHEAPVAPLGVGGPHLLARHHPLVAVEHGPGLHVGEVRAGVGLGVALAPQLDPPADGVEEPGLLFVCAVGDQGRAQQPFPHDVDPGRSVGPDVLLVPDDLLGHGGAPAAVLDGPAHARPAVGAELALPGRAQLPALVLLAGPAQAPCSANSPVRLASSQSRASARKAASSGLSWRSMGVGVGGMLPGRSGSGVTIPKGSASSPEDWNSWPPAGVTGTWDYFRRCSQDRHDPRGRHQWHLRS